MRVAVIAGAGPAGLTASLELLRRTNVKPLVFDLDSQVGGISKTVNYRGNRMDLGGHRFFSKSDWVMDWWQDILPVVGDDSEPNEIQLTYQSKNRPFNIGNRAALDEDAVMMVRSRLSRIFYRRKFFDYPLKLNWNTVKKLGLGSSAAIGASYVAAQLHQRQPELTLRDFMINRFGNRLYETFFRDYTEKVWGVSCEEISAEWGAQRIKGLSITKAIAHALRKPFSQSGDHRQKSTETSLIERFLYPKFGPGQMWEEVASRVKCAGGEIYLQHKIVGLEVRSEKIVAVEVLDLESRQKRRIPCDFFFSTMPLRELVAQLAKHEQPQLRDIAEGLPYRDFVTVGLLLRRMMPLPGGENSTNGMPPDNWIYVQEPDVKLGRLQIFNNWSPALVADPQKIWLGLEYFCRENDELWSMRNSELMDFAAGELAKIGLAHRSDVLDGTVVRVPKAYPAYFGEYRHIDQVRGYLNQFHNLFAIGRNGMHRYNNQDHSMLAAKTAVDCVCAGSADKRQIWEVNTEDDYHEEASQAA